VRGSVLADLFSPLILAILTIFPLCMVVAAVYDLTTFTIPNKLSIALVIGFFVMALITGVSLGEIAIHLGVGFAVLLVGMGLFAMNLVGGGDAKFFAATALWIGWTPLLYYIVLFAIIGGAFSLLLLLFRQMILPEFLIRQKWIEKLHDRQSGIPYGVALAGGGLIVFPETTLFLAAF